MGILQKVAESFEIAACAGGLRALTSSRPRSLASFKLVRDLRQSGLQFSTVIDGGANVGQFARAIADAYPSATIHSFEPLPDLAAQLQQNLADVPRLQIHQTALGDRDGETEFHRNAYSQSSSILPLSKADDSLLYNKQQVEKTTVQLIRLDTVFADEPLQPAALLKLDLQGFELQALQGGKKTLAACSHLLLETVFESAYEGEPLFEEIREYLASHDFRFCRPVNFARQPDGRIVQMDALFEQTGQTR